MSLVASPASPELLYLPLAALATLGVGLQCAIRRHPHRRLYLFCAVWMGVTIAPVMDLKALPPQMLIQDRYLYLTSAGWCVMVGDWTYDLAPAERAKAGSYGARRRWCWLPTRPRSDSRALLARTT